jgi:hypothetical protein
MTDLDGPPDNNLEIAKIIRSLNEHIIGIHLVDLSTADIVYQEPQRLVDRQHVAALAKDFISNGILGQATCHLEAVVYSPDLHLPEDAGIPISQLKLGVFIGQHRALATQEASKAGLPQEKAYWSFKLYRPCTSNGFGHLFNR